jgi:hypothetical protein
MSTVSSLGSLVAGNGSHILATTSMHCLLHPATSWSLVMLLAQCAILLHTGMVVLSSEWYGVDAAYAWISTSLVEGLLQRYICNESFNQNILTRVER